MRYHHELTGKSLKLLIDNGEVTLGGNYRLKIYGLLTCSSGKRIKKDNRVFFKNETEAIQLGFRPCGHCLKVSYNNWKTRQ